MWFMVVYTGCIVGCFSIYHPAIMFVSMGMVAGGIFMGTVKRNTTSR